MVRLVVATVASTVAAKDDVILLQMRSLSSLEAGTEDKALSAMAASMKELLLAEPDVMKRDSTQNFVSGMQAEITAMKGALEAQNSDDNADVAAHIAAINKCNSDKQTSWDAAETGVAARWVGVDGRISSHRTCRVAELGLIEDENAKCDLKRTTGDNYKGTLKTCLTGAATAEAIATCLDPTCGHESDLDAKILACSEAVALTTAKSTECTGEQNNLESDFCTAVEHENSVCGTHSSCYATASQAYTDKQTAFTGKLESQNAMWTSISHIECLFGLFNTGAQVSAGAVDTCLGTAIATKFSLNYPAAEVEAPCDSARTTWAASAYTDLKHVASRNAETQPIDPVAVQASCVGV